MNILKWLFDPNYGLEDRQILAMQNLQRHFSERQQDIDRGLYEAQSKGIQIDWRGVECMRYEMNDSYAYMMFKIKNNPEEIRDDGTFKTTYYENNKPVRIE